MTSFFSWLFKSKKAETAAAPTVSPLDYDSLISLDAEALAEQGISEAYEGILPELGKYVDCPAQMEEVMDSEMTSYTIRCGDDSYGIYAPELDDTEGGAWGRAAYALFAIINKQLDHAPVRFYAINGGNDLGGLFLTPEQAGKAQATLPRKSDWPYIPEPDAPWFGMHH